MSAAALPQAASVHAKGLGDYVTATDTDSEAAVVGVLSREAPEIPVLAEEAGGAREDLMWAVDPLVGTTNFVRGLPVVGVSVGLIERGLPVVGVVLAPFLGLEFAGALESGVTLNGRPLPRLQSRPNAEAIVATGFPFRDKRRLPRYRAVMEGALDEFEDLRRAGAASLDLAWTASGAHDGFFELGLGPWDLADLLAIQLDMHGLTG